MNIDNRLIFCEINSAHKGDNLKFYRVGPGVEGLWIARWEEGKSGNQRERESGSFQWGPRKIMMRSEGQRGAWWGIKSTLSWWCGRFRSIITFSCLRPYEFIYLFIYFYLFIFLAYFCNGDWWLSRVHVRRRTAIRIRDPYVKFENGGREFRLQLSQPL